MAVGKHRYNSNAVIAREDLAATLRNSLLVKRAVQRNACLLCCDSPVNAAGLCAMCFPYISEEERRLCEPFFWHIDP